MNCRISWLFLAGLAVFDAAAARPQVLDVSAAFPGSSPVPSAVESLDAAVAGILVEIDQDESGRLSRRLPLDRLPYSITTRTVLDNALRNHDGAVFAITGRRGVDWAQHSFHTERLTIHAGGPVQASLFNSLASPNGSAFFAFAEPPGGPIAVLREKLRKPLEALLDETRADPGARAPASFVPSANADATRPAIGETVIIALAHRDSDNRHLILDQVFAVPASINISLNSGGGKAYPAGAEPSPPNASLPAENASDSADGVRVIGVQTDPNGKATSVGFEIDPRKGRPAPSHP